MTTASAPAGTGAPVITFQVCPGSSARSATVPAGTVPSTSKPTGSSALAARTSSARTA